MFVKLEVANETIQYTTIKGKERNGKLFNANNPFNQTVTNNKMSIDVINKITNVILKEYS